MNVRKTEPEIKIVDVCKQSLWQEKARSGTLSCASVSIPLSHMVFSAPASFVILLLILSPLVSFPSPPPSVDLPCGCPMTLSRRGG